MSKFVDIKTEYAKDKNLKEEDVKTIVNWVKSQPHLPEITEFQAIAFLKKNFYHIAPAKKTIDTFFILKRLWPDILTGKNLSTSPLKGIVNSLIYLPLPGKTPEGDTLFLMKILNFDIVNYELSEVAKIVDMAMLLHLHQHGTFESYRALIDFKNLPEEYIPKLNFSVFKRFYYYMYEVLPGYPKGIHCLANFSFFDELFAAVRSAVPKAMIPILHKHKSVEDVGKYIPVELLPADYGGSVDSVDVLKEKWNNNLLENAAFFEWQDQQVVDEDKITSKTETDLEVEKSLHVIY